MIQCKRYPHVKDLIEHYARLTNDKLVLSLLEKDVENEHEATALAQFIWKMVEQMGVDSENKTTILGRTDNTDTIPDIDYEISLYLANLGYEEIWERTCNEE